MPCDEVQMQLLGGQSQRAQSQTDGTRVNSCIWGLGRSRQHIEKLFFPRRVLQTWDRSPERCGMWYSRSQPDKATDTPNLVLEAVLLPMGGLSGDPQAPLHQPCVSSSTFLPGIVVPVQDVSAFPCTQPLQTAFRCILSKKIPTPPQTRWKSSRPSEISVFSSATTEYETGV